MESYWGIAGLVLGFGGSLHCLGMCGPLVMAVPFGKCVRDAQFHMFLYLVSKAVGYSIIGLLFSLFGLGITFIISQRFLSFLSAAIILILLFSKKIYKVSIINKFSVQINNIIAQIANQGKWYHYLAFGLFNAFLPCSMVLIAASATITLGNSIHGTIFMFLFGMGTIPALLMAGKFTMFLGLRLRANMRVISSLVAFTLSVLLIVRGINPHFLHKHSKSEISLCKPISK